MVNSRIFSSIIFICVLLHVNLSKETKKIVRILGGRKAAINEFPFQASLQKRSKYGYFHSCGAVLIAPEWLLTAAHCIKSNSTYDYKIMTGSNVLKPVDAENFYSVNTIIIKQGFEPPTLNNDIALIKISRPAKNFEPTIQLPDSDPDLNNTATVAGWGATIDGGTVSNDLLSADVNIMPRDECLQYYYNGITESMLCAGYAEGGIDACQGDSGGPLVQFQNDQVFIIGIVSWGVGCAEPKSPGVYTKVEIFSPWIRHYVFPK